MSKSWFNKLLQINEENKKLKKRIVELEEENQVLTDLLKSQQRKSEQRDLEQQANGLQDWVYSEKDITNSAPPSLTSAFDKGVHLTLLDADKKAKQLRNQAKELNQ